MRRSRRRTRRPLLPQVGQGWVLGWQRMSTTWSRGRMHTACAPGGNGGEVPLLWDAGRILQPRSQLRLALGQSSLGISAKCQVAGSACPGQEPLVGAGLAVDMEFALDLGPG